MICSPLRVGGLALGALAAIPAAQARAGEQPRASVSELVVTAPATVAPLATAPTTRESIDANTVARTINLVTPEDTLRYLPNVLIRQRHVGDTQSPITTRTSGVGASARSLIYVDGVLISALIGNNNTSASPKWGLVAPEAVERVDVLYGPFAAAFAGNSIGAVVSFTTRMPTRLEATGEIQGAAQSFSKYGDDRTYGVGRLAVSLGDRLGRFAFRLSYNHLDARAQPLTYATATIPAATSAAGAPVTGAFVDTNRNGQPILVLGSTGIEHQRQDNLSGRLTYDLSPSLTAAYTLGLFHNDDHSTVNSYLRDGAGQAVYTGTVNVGGRSYALANSTFSNGVYWLEELQAAQGLSLTSHTGGAFDFQLVASRFDYLKSRQRTPSGALPAAFADGPGSTTSMDHTGWYTLDADGTWRPFGMGGAHTISFGAHQDGFRLENPRYALSDWISSAAGPALALNRGRTQTGALWAQDVWTVAPHLTATVGGRWERWRAFGGLNYSASPPLAVVQPRERRDAFSPKAVLAFAPSDAWLLKASVGLAYRFPTVTELYQSVTVGTQLQTPNPNLRPERALSSELSAERSWSDASLRVSVFDERIRDALLSQTALLSSGASASFVQNVDRTHATGVEIAGDRKNLFVHGFELSGWVTYVRAKTEEDRAFPAAVGKDLPQLPRWRGAVVATYAATPRLDATLAARFSERSYGTIDNSDVRANTYFGFGAYFVVDAHVRYRLTPHLAAEVGVDNLNARSYFLFHPFPQRTFVADIKYSY